MGQCSRFFTGLESLRSLPDYTLGSGGRIRTCDLRVMSPTSCHCSTPRCDQSDLCSDLVTLVKQFLCSYWCRSKTSTISTAQLNILLCLHMLPIKQVVYLRSYLVKPVGDLILRWASHLDAFSVYPIRTWLPSIAAGATTDTPEVRPSQSSRTRESSSQISSAHNG